MRFKSITIRNFFSFGDKPQTLDLSNSGLYLIIGNNEETGDSNGSGKCVAKHTKIVTKQYGEIEIQNIYPEAQNGIIYHPDEILEVQTDEGWKQIEAFWVTEPEELYELELENGQTLIASEDHRVMTQKGWKKLKNLTENDNIVVK